MPILVTNNNDHMVYLLSHCGNSVPVGAKARKVQVANQFSWQVPEGVTWEPDGDDEVDPTTYVRHDVETLPMVSPPRTAKEAKKLEQQGLHPHQTPQQRAAMQANAKRLLEDLAKKSSESSSAAIGARRGHGVSREEALKQRTTDED